MNLSISIVSHGSGRLIEPLLADLRRILPAEAEIILTINIPEDEGFLGAYRDLPLSVIRNATANGFGANHNQAFEASSGQFFVIVNPDVRLPTSPFPALLAAAAESARAGAFAPVVRSPGGEVEDSIRRFPTFGRLALRVLLGRRSPDYPHELPAPTPIDWAAGMFVMFRRESFMAVGGFDTRYFMYMEDADICRRLWAAGWQVLLVPQADVIHDAQRASRRQGQHVRWHLRSAIRFLFGI